MNRMIAAALAGAVIGGGGVALARLVPGGESADTITIDATQAPLVDGLQTIDIDQLLGSTRGVAGRARTIESIAGADLAQLPELVWDLASEAESPARNYALGLAVRRLAERDAGQALAVLGQTFLDPRTAREVARIVLEQLEPEPASVDVVLEALPQIDAYELQVDAVVLFADSSVEAALGYALELEHRGQQRRALRAAGPQLLAETAATFAFVDTIPDEAVRREFEATLIGELASDDIAAARRLFAERYADSELEGERVGQRMVRLLSQEAPATAIALIGALDLDGRGGWTRAAMAWLARTDPEAGMAYAERPSTEPFNPVRGTVATVLAEQNPDATIEWLRSLDPMPPDLAAGVVSGVARVDPLRAIELGEELSVTGSLDGVDTLAQSASLIAERVLAVQDPARRDEWLESLLQGWGWVDDVAALDWAVANAGRLSPDLFERLGRAHGNDDPTTALLQTTRLPEQAQEAWVSAVMREVMGADPAAALDWVGQFRGQAVYDLAAASVVSSGIWLDAEPVRTVFDTLSEDRQATVAQRFARTWYRADGDAARAWVTGLAPGAVRDEALTGFIEIGVNMRVFDPENVFPDDSVQGFTEPLMELYSSDTARGGAVLGMLESVARRDAVEARQMIDAYVEDPELRERGELLLQAFQR